MVSSCCVVSAQRPVNALSCSMRNLQMTMLHQTVSASPLETLMCKGGNEAHETVLL